MHETFEVKGKASSKECGEACREGMLIMNYEMEELLPIVAELADRYTGKESTSVSYERARALMEAVLYCINRCGGDNQLVAGERIPARLAYQRGYDNLIRRVKKTQDAYNKMIVDFCAYGNENYHDTVTKAIPGFFRYYDVRFAPQETIITMDYPTICPITDKSGIDAIEIYVEDIAYEQTFMNALPQEYVCDVLYRFQAGYRKQFYNICSIILRHILGHMAIGKSLGQAGTCEDYESLRDRIREKNREEIEQLFSDCLEQLIVEKYQGEQLLERYLRADLRDFTTEICVAAQNNKLERVVVL